MANGLIAEGIRPQARVAHLDKSSDIFFELLFGAAKANAVMVSVNWRLAPPEVLHIINDAVGGKPIAVVLENDTASFYAWSTVLEKDTLHFIYSDSTKMMIDQQSNSVWNLSGQCQSGSRQGMKLNPVQAYQEYWHSWRTFHPQTKKFVAP